MRKLKKALSHARKGTTSTPGIKDTTTFVNHHDHVSRTANKVLTNENAPFVAKQELKLSPLMSHRNDAGPSVITESSDPHASLMKKFVKKPSQCPVRNCRGIKSPDIEAVQLRQLIIRVKELKKNVETINLSHSAPKSPEKPKKVESTQTLVDDIASAIVTLDHCKNQLVKLERFFIEDPTKLGDNLDRKCCSIAMPHVHTLVDGLAAVIQYSVDRTLVITRDEEPSTSRETEVKEEIWEKNEEAEVKEVKSCETRDLRVCPQMITNAPSMKSMEEVEGPLETFISENTPRIMKTIKK